MVNQYRREQRRILEAELPDELCGSAHDQHHDQSLREDDQEGIVMDQIKAAFEELKAYAKMSFLAPGGLAALQKLEYAIYGEPVEEPSPEPPPIPKTKSRPPKEG
jgi:hypothetical protein